MNLVGIGDIHIKIHHNVPLAFQQDRYEQFIEGMISHCQEREATLLLAGDQLDNNMPKKEELQLFLRMLIRLEEESIPTVLVSGNHETIQRGVSILDYLELEVFDNLYYRRPRIDSVRGVNIHPVNHDSLKDELERPTEVGKGMNILLSHARGDFNKFVREEVPISDLAEPFDLVVLGDIHDEFDLAPNIFYTNNPLNKDFEAAPNCGWVDIELDPENKTFTKTREKTDFPSLLKMSCPASDYPPPTSARHYYKIEVTGKREELRQLDSKQDNSLAVPVPDIDAVLEVDSDDKEKIHDHLEDELSDYLATDLDWAPERVDLMMHVYKETV